MERIFPQAALGFRAWDMKDNALFPLFKGSPWRPGSNLAYCHSEQGHTAPDANCHCGFNLYHQLSKAAEQRGAEDPRRIIIGAVAGKGALEIHADGFRCEHAQVIGLYSPAGSYTIIKREARQLAERYDVPLCDSLEELQRLADNCSARPVPADLKPSLDTSNRGRLPLGTKPLSSASKHMLASISLPKSMLLWLLTSVLFISCFLMIASVGLSLWTHTVYLLIFFASWAASLAAIIALKYLQPQPDSS